MAFNDLFRTANRVALAVVGEPVQFNRLSPSEVIADVMAVLERGVEMLDDNDQVVGLTNTVCIAHTAIAFTPVRGDFVVAGGITYTLGKRLEDDGFAYLFEATT